MIFRPGAQVRHNNFAIQVPGGVSKHRHHECKPEEEGQRADDGQPSSPGRCASEGRLALVCARDVDPLVIGIVMICSVRELRMISDLENGVGRLLRHHALAAGCPLHLQERENLSLRQKLPK